MVPDDIKPTVRRSRSKTERRLVAVLGLDILSYSALMGRGEEQVHRRVGAELERVCREAERSHGRVFTFAGDSVMAEFPSAVEALRCAMRIQESAARRNARLPPDDRILFRLGLNTGEVVVQSDRIGGTTVNVAARLEALAEPGGINLSAAVFEQVQRVIAAPYVAIGPKQLKNIRDPVSVYAIAASVFAGDDAVLLPPDVPTRGNRTRGFAPPAAFSLPDKPSIAVLPFLNMSTEPEQDFLADGIAEDVITALSRYPSVFVIARNSCFSYKGRAVEVREIGRELGVRYILGGGLRKSGSRIRITAQLVQAETGNHIWAERYDRDLADIFTVQDEISEAVTIAVAPAIDAAELQRAIRKPPGNLDAWVAYQRGLWHLSKFTSSDISLAEEFFRQAIDLDVTFAGGYAGLASAQLHGAVAFHTRGLSEAIISIDALARRAVELDGADAEARACLGGVLLLGGDHQGARAMIELAVTIESEPEQRTRSARPHANLLGFAGGGNSFAPNEHKARSPPLCFGIPFAAASGGSLFLRRIRGLSRGSETSDPLLPRFSGSSPLARRGVRSARPY